MGSLPCPGHPGFQQCRKYTALCLAIGTPSRELGGPVFRNVANYRSGCATTALFRELGRPAFGNAANYSSYPPELPLPLANWAARLAQGPRDTQNLNDPGRYLRHFAGPECLPRGREATLLPETVIRIEGVNKNRRAAAARARTTEQPLVDRAPPGALNHQHLNV